MTQLNLVTPYFTIDNSGLFRSPSSPDFFLDESIYNQDSDNDPFSDYNPYYNIKERKIINGNNYNEIFEYTDTLNLGEKISFIKQIIGEGKLDLFVKILNFTNLDLLHYNNLFLKTASISRSENIVLYLIQNGADVTIDNHFVLESMFLGCSMQTLKILIDYGSDISAIFDKLAKVCAHHIVFDKVKLLVESGADIHQNDNQPLISAIRYNNDDVALYLIKNGANICARNNEALRISVSQLKSEMVDFLLNNGADITEITADDIIYCIHRHFSDKTVRIHVRNTLNVLIKHGMNLSFINNTNFNVSQDNNFISFLVSNGVDLTLIDNIMDSKIIRKY